MKRGSGSRLRVSGYTVVETLIFLAVTTAMFASVMLMINGQQQRAEFTQAVRDMESSLQDIANDVATGFAAYPFNPGESCKVNPAGNVIINNSPVGGLERCIFIGRVIQFSPQGSNGQAYQVYTVVGRQHVTATNREVASLAEATPVALAPGSGAHASISNLSQRITLSGAARIGRVTYQQGGVITDTGAFGFFTTFQNYSTGNISSGALYADLAPVSLTGLNQTSTTIVDRVDAHTAASASLTPLNPNGGVTVCLLSNGSSQYALIKMGGGGAGRLAVTTTIESGSACP